MNSEVTIDCLGHNLNFELFRFKIIFYYHTIILFSDCYEFKFLYMHIITEDYHTKMKRKFDMRKKRKLSNTSSNGTYSMYIIVLFPFFYRTSIW